DAYDLWISRAEALVERHAIIRPAFTYFTTAIDIAFARGQRERARELMRQMHGHGLMNESPMRASWVVPLTLRSKLAFGTVEPSDEDAARTILARFSASMTGVNDFEVATACEVLACRGKGLEAREEMTNYLREKRVGSHPPSLAVRIACERVSLDVWSTWSRGAQRQVPSVQEFVGG